MRNRRTNGQNPGSNIWTLVLGIALIPLCHALYASTTNPDIRCHAPGREGWNTAYELVPYGFVAFLTLFMGAFAMRVVSDDTHVVDSLLGSIMTLVAGIFAFALIFRAYGLEEASGSYTPVLMPQDRIEALLLTDDAGHQTRGDGKAVMQDLYLDRPPANPGRPGGDAVVVIAPDRALDPARRPLVVLERHTRMVQSPWDFLFHSTANAIPGGTAQDYQVCPGVRRFVILQNIIGLVMTIVVALLGNRLGAVRGRSGERTRRGP